MSETEDRLRLESVRAGAARSKDQYDAPMYRLLMEAYGGNSHMGLYGRGDESLAEALERANAQVAANARLAPGETVVEVACGVGGAARHLAAGHGVEVVATNIARVQCADGRRQTEAAGLGDRVHFACADFHELPFADGRFDCWWCQEALIHAADKRRVLTEARRVLRPGGRLVITDIVAGAVAPTEDYARGVIAPDQWSMAEYDAVFAELGLEIRERHDWSPHLVRTFEGMLATVLAHEARFAAEVGADAVAATAERYRLFIEGARRGYSAWAHYVLLRP